MMNRDFLLHLISFTLSACDVFGVLASGGKRPAWLALLASVWPRVDPRTPF